jgi:hypothetical protein
LSRSDLRPRRDSNYSPQRTRCRTFISGGAFGPECWQPTRRPCAADRGDGESAFLVRFGIVMLQSGTVKIGVLPKSQAAFATLAIASFIIHCSGCQASRAFRPFVSKTRNPSSGLRRRPSGSWFHTTRPFVRSIRVAKNGRSSRVTAGQRRQAIRTIFAYAVSPARPQ